MPDWASNDENDYDESVLIEPKQKLKKPPLYKVLLHNDDYTSMEFVIHILENIFQKSQAEAFKLMMAVHLEGLAVVGLYTYEVAETKLSKVSNLAKEQDYPLLCTMEEA